MHTMISHTLRTPMYAAIWELHQAMLQVFASLLALKHSMWYKKNNLSPGSLETDKDPYDGMESPASSPSEVSLDEWDSDCDSELSSSD